MDVRPVGCLWGLDPVVMLAQERLWQALGCRNQQNPLFIVSGMAFCWPTQARAHGEARWTRPVQPQAALILNLPCNYPRVASDDHIDSASHLPPWSQSFSSISVAFFHRSFAVSPLPCTLCNLRLTKALLYRHGSIPTPLFHVFIHPNPPSAAPQAQPTLLPPPLPFRSVTSRSWPAHTPPAKASVMTSRAGRTGSRAGWRWRRR